MLADRAMWASVALVDHLRNGVPLEETPRNHVARTLASLMNVFRLPLDEYWERQMEISDGLNLMLPVMNAGFCQYGFPAELVDYQEVIRYALSERSWEALRKLPDPVWRLLETATGMSRQEWDGLPGFCRSLLAETVFCPECEYSASIESFGEPNSIDDPANLYQQRVKLVFRCPKCGAEAGYDVPKGDSRESKSLLIPKGITGWMVLGFFAVFALVLFWMLITKPSF